MIPCMEGMGAEAEAAVLVAVGDMVVGPGVGASEFS